MPTNTTPARRRRITTTTMVIVATAAIAAGAVGSASPANAEPKKPGATDFYSCVDAKIRSIDNANRGGHTWQDIVDARNSCCAQLGGTWVTDHPGDPDSNGVCFMPDGSPVKPSGPTAPLPGATAILPPGLNTRGIQ
jgi:hypothetical protein